MPLIVDGDIIRGWVRERIILKRLYVQTVMSRSPVFRGYVRGMAKTVDVPEERLIRSEPVRNFLRKLTG
jgi:hypothetical protein